MSNYDYRPDLKEKEEQEAGIRDQIQQAEFIKWLKQRKQKSEGRLG